MKKICLVIFCLLFIQNIPAQRTKQPPDSEELKLSVELKQDSEYVQIGCGYRQRVTDTDMNISYKLKAIQSFTKDGEKTKLKMRCGTTEGDPIFSYLTVEKGKASLLIDASQDDFGPPRLYSYICAELELGKYFIDLKAGRMVFQKIETNEIKDEQIVLRCQADEKELIF